MLPMSASQSPSSLYEMLRIADYGRGATVSAVFVFRERIVRLCARHRWTGNLQQRHEQKLPARDESVRLQRGDLLLPAADA
jgi:hypothetical protein